MSLAERIDGIETDLGRFAETVSALGLELGQAAGASGTETARVVTDRAAAASLAEAA